ncbi:MAG TPA: hypothetical protein VM118_01060 [Acidobacteriota bacterium]|nr:hypothetical protein [Acidobacteriota bacterium]
MSADSTRDSIPAVRDDSVRASVAAPDTLPVDTTPRYPFRGPHGAYDSTRQVWERRFAGPAPPMPAARTLAAGDLADWLGMFGPYDVDDAPGVGQSRFYTRWGLEERHGNWRLEGRPFVRQRLTFPQRAAFDMGVLPSFSWTDYHIGEEIRLDTDTLWSRTARSSYFYRQGDFADTYSEGKFRRLIGSRLGTDLSFTFFDSDGRYADDNRSTRFLSLRLVGAAYRDWHWSYRFVQFRDQTFILTPEPFTSLAPQRNDLLWQMDFDVYRPAGASPGVMAGLRVQSGKQSLRDVWSGYRLRSNDRRWTVWGLTTLRGWNLDGEFLWETLDIDPVTAGRWGARVTAGRTLRLGPDWSAAMRLDVSDYDTDPLAVTAGAVIGPVAERLPLLPELRVSRERTVPSLFDRRRPGADSMFTVEYRGDFAIYDVTYGESGAPDLEAQWDNAVSLVWHNRTPAAGGTPALSYQIEARAAYVENYTRWQDTSSVVTHVSYAPVAEDARTVGFSAALTAPFWGDFALTTAYAAKYAADLDDRRLTGYYPHKGSAILSWVRPQLHWGIDVRANLIGVWMYGDRRIQPTLYTEPHIVRVDLSGTATMGSFHFDYLIQNLFNFEYRTRAGYPGTGRTVRFGLEWHFLD